MFKVCMMYADFTEMPHTIRVAIPDGKGKAVLGKFVFENSDEMYELGQKYYEAYHADRTKILEVHRALEKQYALSNKRGLNVMRNMPADSKTKY